jgi:CheY-like chemotaxis protein
VKARLLIAENNRDMVEVLKRGLQRLGYEVIQAKDGIEAVELATSEVPDLIIMDVVMPRLDGLKAASQIKKNPKTHAIPVLAVTAMGQETDRKRCLQSGCDAYVAKPFTFKKLESVIERLLKD